MDVRHIVITTDSFHSKNKHDIVESNIYYLTKLFQHNLREDKISQEALKSYYVDYYLSHILHAGFSDFIKNFQYQYKTLYYIRKGLEAFKAKKHLYLFNKVFPNRFGQEKNQHLEIDVLNRTFQKIQKSENLTEMNHDWLINHPHLLIMHRDYVDMSIQKYVEEHQKDSRHVKIIKQFCEIINEDFITVTVGDKNNIYNRAWHFKTAQGFYYIIEKNNIVTLYNGFSKEEITQGKLVVNKTEKSVVSEFISQMLA